MKNNIHKKFFPKDVWLKKMSEYRNSNYKRFFKKNSNRKCRRLLNGGKRDE